MGTRWCLAKISTPKIILNRAQSAAEKVGSMAVEQGMKQAEVIISGPGNGRETAIRALQSCGLEVLLIKDITPVPHNGCRPPKKRRV